MAKSEADKLALQTIFTELNAITVKDRRNVMQALQRAVNLQADYIRGKGQNPSQREFNEWQAKVHLHSGKLAALLSDGEFLESHTRAPWPKGKRADLVSRLRALEEDSKEPIKVRRGAPEVDFLSTLPVIAMCHHLYGTRIGKPIGAGRRNNTGREKQGAPTGPFFRLVRAAFSLAGDKAGDESVLSTIRRYQAFKRDQDQAERAPCPVCGQGINSHS
jgi:hypothetical protein